MTPPSAGDADFEIYLAWSDRSLTVKAGQTALQVLLEAGLAISPGCLTGGCGECATVYVEGDIIHIVGLFPRIRPLSRIRVLLSTAGFPQA
jgi:vanillate O-demethylase ferredoxin subunit